MPEVTGVEVVGHSRPEERLGRPPEQFEHRRTDVLDGGLGVYDGHDVARVLHEGSEPFLAVVDTFIGAVRLPDEAVESPDEETGHDRGDDAESDGIGVATLHLCEERDGGCHEERRAEQSDAGARDAGAVGLSGATDQAHRRVQCRRGHEHIRRRPHGIEPVHGAERAVGAQARVDAVADQLDREAGHEHARGGYPPADGQHGVDDPDDQDDVHDRIRERRDPVP